MLVNSFRVFVDSRCGIDSCKLVSFGFDPNSFVTTEKFKLINNYLHSTKYYYCIDLLVFILI